MSNTIKLYAASLMAFTELQKPTNAESGAMYWEHSACLISATSLEYASKQARHLAFRSWPKEQGWSMHSATIVPVTLQFFTSMQQMAQLGHLTGEHLPPEDSGFFKFDDTPADLEPHITGKGH